ANAPHRIVPYFLDLFLGALNKSDSTSAAELFPAVRTSRRPVVGMHTTAVVAVRGTVEKQEIRASGVDVDKGLVFREDQPENRSHDVRLLKNDVFGAGMYRLRCVLRRTGRRHFALQVHHAWKDGVCFGVDCESGEVAYLHEKSTNFDIVQRPRVIFGPD